MKSGTGRQKDEVVIAALKRLRRCGTWMNTAERSKETVDDYGYDVADEQIRHHAARHELKLPKAH